MGTIRLAIHLWSLAARSRMQYRLNLVFQCLGMFLTTIADFLALWALLRLCGSGLGWSLPEAALLYGTVNTAFGLAQVVNGGIEQVPGLIQRGELDLILLRPRPPLLLIATRDLPLRQFGRMGQGALVLAWAVWSLPAMHHPAALALIGWAMIGGLGLYLALSLLQSAACFWTVENLEVWNALTYGGNMAAQWPQELYRPTLRWVLLTVLPVAAVGWLPVSEVLGRAHGFPPWVAWLAPLMALPLLAAAWGLWCLGLKRYASTGS